MAWGKTHEEYDLFEPNFEHLKKLVMAGLEMIFRSFVLGLSNLTWGFHLLGFKSYLVIPQVIPQVASGNLT